MKLSTKDITIFGVLGALMYLSKIVTELAPNIHLVGVFIVALTVVYRKKALYPIYIYVFLAGLFSGFALWWVPYLYIWTILWGAVMMLPQNINKKLCPIVYMIVCAFHGFLYGTLWAPAQAIFYGLNFKGMIAWIVAGIPFDIIHGVSNFISGLLICPLIRGLKRMEN